ncbi:phage tail terminator protein [Rhizobium ruizarguesonis]
MLNLIVERLRAHAAILPAVEMAEDLDVVAKATARVSGTTFIIPLREKAKPNTLMSGGFRQLVREQFLTAIILRHHGDALGSMRASEFSSFKDAIEQAIAGWEPTDVSDPCELVGGEGTPLGNGASVYVQTWETTRFLTVEE